MFKKDLSQEEKESMLKEGARMFNDPEFVLTIEQLIVEPLKNQQVNMSAKK